MTGTPRGEGAEAEKVALRLSGWDINTSMATRRIGKLFPFALTHQHLRALAEVICQQAGFHLDRDAARDNRVLLKWMGEHWVIVQSELPRFTFCDQGLIPLE
jgi:hypothetical protein